MPEYINKIRTDVGDLPVNYEALANLPTISNPNLLINGDFQVDQYGLLTETPTAFSNGKYLIDRWQVAAADQKYSVMEEEGLKFIRITASENPSQFLLLRQLIEMNEPLRQQMLTQGMTQTMKIRASKLSAYHYTPNDIIEVGTDWTILTCNYAYEDYVRYLDHNIFNVYAGIKPIDILTNEDTIFNTGDYVDVAWVKLELGHTATPYVIRPYADELAMCQRYYQPVNLYFKPGITSSDGTTVTFTSDVHLRNLTNNNPAITMYQTPTALRTTGSNAITTTLTFNNVYCLDGLIAITFNSSANLGARTTVWSYNSFKVYANAEVY